MNGKNETDAFNCGDYGPLFLKIRPGDFNYWLTTAELTAQGGWPKPDVNNQIPYWLSYSKWKTAVPPPSCTWNQ
jgi:hypothetical protein